MIAALYVQPGGVYYGLDNKTPALFRDTLIALAESART